ncbi:3-phosphoserine/phosphohydroxythreonine transaminase [uncultured Thiodictyon sp.]|uniref:3-phosphoserine/phosphohydroxythreonine transaminase n=1 Tax=uncultured Thiodictyon sp. TaxID=1846217 RepID=UPI0025DF2F75|nr:3-phosphoserine/phosphohydroxythreonine transaminase [uncultured Thiodictyon sp.]
MSRVYNFSAGPAMLPESVLRKAQDEMLDWQGSGMCVAEMSHRGKEYMAIAAQAEADLRELLGVPTNYKVLFLQGGASTQFAMVPMNLLRGAEGADYLNTGSWSKKAISEARRYGRVNVASTTEDTKFNRAPVQSELKLNADAAYLHFTPNETIEGVEFPYLPECGDTPLVADMSSTLLSRPIDVSRYGLIYAGAQKNIGPAGLTIVIVREDLIGQPLAGTPTMFDYKIHADNDSMYNTPPTYAWYLAGLVFQWVKDLGGLEAVATINRRKADLLYSTIDASGFYRNPVSPESRSWMNVPFTLPSADLDDAFLKGAKAAGLTTLKGHRSVGGMRASIYNAMPEAGVQALAAYMQEFERTHG